MQDLGHKYAPMIGRPYSVANIETAASGCYPGGAEMTATGNHRA